MTGTLPTLVRHRPGRNRKRENLPGLPWLNRPYGVTQGGSTESPYLTEEDRMSSKAKQAERNAKWRAGFRKAPAPQKAPARLDLTSVTSQKAAYSAAAANLPEIVRSRPDASTFSSATGYVKPTTGSSDTFNTQWTAPLTREAPYSKWSPRITWDRAA